MPVGAGDLCLLGESLTSLGCLSSPDLGWILGSIQGLRSSFVIRDFGKVLAGWNDIGAGGQQT